MVVLLYTARRQQYFRVMKLETRQNRKRTDLSVWWGSYVFECLVQQFFKRLLRKIGNAVNCLNRSLNKQLNRQNRKSSKLKNCCKWMKWRLLSNKNFNIFDIVSRWDLFIENILILDSIHLSRWWIFFLLLLNEKSSGWKISQVKISVQNSAFSHSLNFYR